MKVYIVIVTYNGMAWLAKCLASIPKEYSVVVIDNNSSDNSVPFIEQNYPQVQVFKETKNLGFGQANNKGMLYALENDADYVYLLNQDAYLEENTIQGLIEIHRAHEQLGILSPLHVNKDKTRLDRLFCKYVSYDHTQDFFSDYVLGNVKKDFYEVPFINAAGWLLPIKTLKTVGGFDPIFFHYGEDRNYAQRVLYHNFKIAVVPQVKMVHDREDRKIKQPKLHSDSYYKNLEKKIKVRFANINSDNLNGLEHQIVKLKKAIFKDVVRLNFKSYRSRTAILNSYKNCKKEILISREKNKQKGQTYLFKR